MARAIRGGRAGRFAYERLDRILHEKARLGIMTCLATEPAGVRFGDLKHLCALTDGNLSRHLDALDAAGLVEIWKGFDKRRPQTICRLAPEGRERFLAYLKELARVIRDATPPGSRRSVKAGGMPEGWHRRSADR